MNQAGSAKSKNIIRLALLIVVLAISFNVLAQDLGPSKISSIAFSPDGQKIAAAGGPAICSTSPSDINDYFTIQIFNLLTSKLIKKIGRHTCSINSLSWNPDGTRIVSSSDEGTSIIWDVATGEEVVRYSGSGYGVASLFGALWNPVDERIVVLGGGRDVVIWDAKTGNLVTRVYSPQMLGVMFADWSPDGTRLALGTAMDKIQIFDVSPAVKNPPLLLQIDSGSMTNLRWSPDGTQIATTSGPNIQIFDATMGNLTKSLTGSTDDLWGVSWTAVGNRIAAGGDDYKVRVWDVATAEETAVFDHQASITAVDWSPDGQSLVFGGSQNADQKGFEIVSVPFKVSDATGEAQAR